ncbi:MAG: flavin oxidoreductase/NADH oxidase [Oscillospiraceae bacterium]
MSLVIVSREKFFEEQQKTQCKLPFSEDISALKKSVKIGNRTAENRIVYQAMEGCDGTTKGEPGELTARRYHRFAKGGAGIIWFEATAVQTEGKANPRQMFSSENNVGAFAKLVLEMKEICLKENGFEPLIIAQLTHSGRYSKPNGKPEPLIAYNNPIFEKENPIGRERIVDDDYLDRVLDNLVKAAVLAQKAGFDGVDIKSCHRYLLSELLSAYERGGKYGGSFENRTRLLLGAVDGAVKSCNGDFIISSRFNCYDGFPYPYGFGVENDGSQKPCYSEAMLLAEKLESAGAAMLNVTMGNPYFNPHVNRPYAVGEYEPPEAPLMGVARMLEGAAAVQNCVSLPVACSGISYLGAVSHNVTAKAISDGMFSMAGYGRMTLAYPDIARDIVKNDRVDGEKICITCGKCTEIMRAGGTPGCVIRDSEKYLPIYKDYKGAIKK